MEIEDLTRIEIEADSKLGENLHAVLRQVAVGAIYGLSYLMLGAEPWKAAVISMTIWACLALGLGRRVIMRVGLIFVPYAMLFWIGWAPDPSLLKSLACR